MVDTNSRPAYVDVAEVCRDWGCSRSNILDGMKKLLKETVPANGSSMLMDETMQKQENEIADDMLDFAFAMGE